MIHPLHKHPNKWSCSHYFETHVPVKIKSTGINKQNMMPIVKNKKVLICNVCGRKFSV